MVRCVEAGCKSFPDYTIDPLGFSLGPKLSAKIHRSGARNLEN